MQATFPYDLNIIHLTNEFACSTHILEPTHKFQQDMTCSFHNGTRDSLRLVQFEWEMACLYLSPVRWKWIKLDSWLSMLKFFPTLVPSGMVAWNPFESCLMCPSSKILLHSATEKQLACNRSEQGWEASVFFKKIVINSIHQRAYIGNICL